MAGKLLVGAKAISRHIYGSEDHQRSISPLAETGELPIFWMRGRLHAYDDKLDAALAAKQQGGQTRPRRPIGDATSP